MAQLERRSPAHARVSEAAVELFTTHGVNGTSLQMIADAAGIRKSSVYYLFKTKDEIVIAAAEADLAELEEVLDEAEAEPDHARRLDLLIDRMIDLAIERRHMVGLLQSDPVMVRLLAEHEPFRRVMQRLHAVLQRDAEGNDGRTPAAMLSAAITGAVIHPYVADMDADELRDQMRDLARALLRLPS